MSNMQDGKNHVQHELRCVRWADHRSHPEKPREGRMCFECTVCGKGFLRMLLATRTI